MQQQPQKLQQKWQSVLRQCREELHTASTPLTSPSLNDHTASIKDLRLRTEQIDHAIHEHLHEYEHLLELCSEATNADCRAHAVRCVRYLEVKWLPQFSRRLQAIS